MSERRVKRSLGCRRGTALLESALVLLVSMALTIAIVDLGQILFLRASIVERMRAALRAGVITYDEAAIKNIVLYGKATPAPGAIPSFNLQESMVLVSRLGLNETSDRVRITLTNYPLISFSPLGFKHAVWKPLTLVQSMEAGNLP